MGSDGNRFVQTFASSMEEHPLLIYLSALPFTPADSLLFRTFVDQSTPRILGGYNKSWPSLRQMLTGHEKHVHALAFSPDGTKIASASLDCTIRVWDLSSGVALLTLKGHTDEVFAVAFSTDGRQIVSGSMDRTIRLWDAISSIDCLMVLNGHTDSVFAVAFAPDGNRIASGSRDGAIHVWETSTQSDIFGPLLGHDEESVATLVFMPDGKRLLSGARDDTILVWDMITGIVTQVLRGHNNAVQALSISSDQKYLASASADCTIRIWDIATGEERQVMRGPDMMRHVAFLPGDKRIVSFDYMVRLWDAETGAQILASAKHQADSCMAVTPNGDRLAFAYADRVGVMDTSFLHDDIQSTNEDQGDISSLVFSPDGQRFASISEDDCRIRLWDVGTGREACSPLQGHKNTVTSVAFSLDGSLIVSGSQDTKIIIWNTLLGRELLPLCGHNGAVISVVFSPDGMQILSGSSDDTVRLWDLTTCTEIHTPMGRWCHEGIVSVAFHPSGDRVISGSRQGDIVCWHARTGERLFKQRAIERPNIMKSVTFSSRAQRLMISCQYFKDQAPCEVVHTLSNGHEPEAITPITVTPDGWIHDFKTQSVIGKLPSIVSIPVYSSSSSAIVFTAHGRASTASIMHFPPSELTEPGTSNLSSLFCAKGIGRTDPPKGTGTEMMPFDTRSPPMLKRKREVED